MHQAGGSGLRETALRRRPVRQRGTACLACSTSSSVVAPNTSHSRAVRSHEAVTTRRPSGLTAALCTRPSWPRKTPICWPLATSQSRAVLSLDAVTTLRPFGLKRRYTPQPHGPGGRDLISARRIPQSHCSIPGGSYDKAPIWAERGAYQNPIMAPEHADLPAASRVPYVQRFAQSEEDPRRRHPRPPSFTTRPIWPFPMREAPYSAESHAHDLGAFRS